VREGAFCHPGETNEEEQRKGHHTTLGPVDRAVIPPRTISELGQPARLWRKGSSLLHVKGFNLFQGHDGSGLLAMGFLSRI
jgi:hypothetical protein